MADSIFNRSMFSFDPRMVMREGEYMTPAQSAALYNHFLKIDPNSRLRYGEPLTEDQVSGLMNLLDPRSTVREGEYMTAANTIDVPDSIKKEYNKLISSDPYSVVREGEMPTEKQMSSLLNLLDPNSVVREGEYKRGIDPNSVVREGEMPTEDQVDQYTLIVNDPEFQSFLMDSYGDKGLSILDLLLQGNTPDNFSYLTNLMNEFTNYKISNEMKEKGALEPKPFEIPEQELNYLNRLKNRAEGSPMEGETVDAVGIADGLDSEEEVSMTAESGSSDDGIAKVSPEQYVQLMNEVRGDDVPLEGRVQELAMTVGEKDARDTPLSVLALVQPVFELQEKEGIASTDQAQTMMPPMASDQLMNPKNGGIVRAAGSIFVDGQDMRNLGGEDLIGFGKEFFGYGDAPIDIVQRSGEIEKQLLDRADLKNQALLYASPYLANIAANILDPEKEMSQVIPEAFSDVGRYGATVSQLKEPYKKAALSMAADEKKAQQDRLNKFSELVGGEMVKSIFREEEFITDPYTGMLLNKRTGQPIDLVLYGEIKAEKDVERSNTKLKQSIPQTLITKLEEDGELTEELRSQILLDPQKYLDMVFKDPEEKKAFFIQQSNKIREEHTKASEEFVKMKNKFETIKAKAEDPSAAGDVALIFQFMKLLDPQSVVRESEYATAANAGSIPSRIRAQFNKALDGEALAPEIREDFVNTARVLFEKSWQVQQNVDMRYKNLALGYELPTQYIENSIMDYTDEVNKMLAPYTMGKTTSEEDEEKALDILKKPNG